MANISWFRLLKCQNVMLSLSYMMGLDCCNYCAELDFWPNQLSNCVLFGPVYHSFILLTCSK